MSSKILDILLDLPGDLVCSVLSEWVDVKGLSAVDVAYCNHDKRMILLTTISSEQFVLSESPQIGPTNYIIWIKNRGIRQNECFVEGNMVDFVQYVKMFGTYLKRVTIITPHLEVHGVDNMIKAFSYCVWMESLELLDVNVCQEILDAVSNCPFVHELKISFLEPTLIEGVFPLTVHDAGLLQLSTLIVEGCMAHATELLEMTSPTALQALQVEVSDGYDADVSCKFLAAGCNLKALCITSEPSNNDCISLVKLCPDLRYLDLECYMMTEECVPELAALLARTQLKVLRLNLCTFSGPLLSTLAELGCETLKMVFLDSCTFECSDFNNIARCCKGLTHLRFALRNKQKLFGIDWHQLSNLTHLNLGRSLNRDVDENTILEYIANYCTKLTNLAVGSNTCLIPCDLSALYDRAILPALSVLNVHRANDDTSMLQFHRPNLQIGRFSNSEWHRFEDVVRDKKYSVWK